MYSVDTAVLTTRAAKDKEKRKRYFAAANPDGPEEVHSWCEYRSLGGGVFGQTRTSVHFRPTLGDLVLYEIEGPSGERVVVRDATNIPEIEIALTDSWDPREETLIEAETRIMERAKMQLRPRLESIQAKVNQAVLEGRVAKHDTPSSLLKHMAWAFMHEALCCTYPEIESKHLAWSGLLAPQDSIQRAVYNLAPLLGLRRKF